MTRREKIVPRGEFRKGIVILVPNLTHDQEKQVLRPDVRRVCVEVN